MLIQAALNGDRTKSDHPAVPLSLEELIRDAVACVAAGARAVHLHPRDAAGLEALEPVIVDEVTTGAWIEPDLARRLAQVRAWCAPDYASVNLSEPGAIEIMQALLEAGVGI